VPRSLKEREVAAASRLMPEPQVDIAQTSRTSHTAGARVKLMHITRLGKYGSCVPILTTSVKVQKDIGQLHVVLAYCADR